ncbi:hypothetical protein C0993_011718 [Termitomyces sp. T159_Od127]|nr:hypothetical protein C0993_011718 [Termitomyces sp. T159_Od127]
MNKLRKPMSPSGTSRTMHLAKDLSLSLKATTSRAYDGPTQQHPLRRTQPVTINETDIIAIKSKDIQYWTMRAHSAEAQLQSALSASRGQYAQHLRDHNSSIQDVSRRKDDEKIARLEWLVIILLVLISVFIVIILYITASYATPKKAPAHFTIPILSPFTSSTRRR